ncbi:MAG: hypothetical protein V2I33_06490, partial [Kangiellaceae bacterium]|nr:hypothetical protein [Kangiellaceae bacterium]
MKKIIILFAILSSLAFASTLPVEHFSKDLMYDGIKISPDGKHLAAVTNFQGTRILVILDKTTMEVRFAFRFGTHKHVDEYYWVNDERIIFTQYFRQPWSEEKVTYKQVFAGNIDGSKRKNIFGYKMD